jgi:2-keto-4-pentenoate hydratase/2-oxohepta-3-ene-1,7-dioic acid hydratase in catechol pathway
MRRRRVRAGLIVTTLLAAAFASIYCQRGATAGARQEAPAGVTKYVRFQLGDTVAYGIVEGDQVRQLEGDLFGEWSRTDQTHPLSSVKLLYPSARPSKVLAVAGNYRSHLDTDAEVAPYPEMFIKVPSALQHPEEDIVIPEMAPYCDYEGELVIVIGKRAKKVAKSEALDYVLGVTCGNDVSARAWQRNDVQWWRAKACDTFAPCGPCIVSGINYDDLLLTLRLNGEVKQQQRTSDMIHGVASIVSFVSQHMTLEPGDLIYTGTPGETSPIRPGDIVEVELEGVGVLRNGVRAEQ